MDFNYSGETARVLWTEIAEKFEPDSKGDPSNTYYPSVVRLHFMPDASKPLDVDNDVILVSTTQNDDGQPFGIRSTLAPYPVGSNIKESDDWVAYPTLGHGSDPNYLTVFYQTFPIEDSVAFSDTSNHLYASIYSQASTDGGLTWSDPAPFRTNNAPVGTYGKMDFRWPQVSDWNPISGGKLIAHVMYGADTAAGEGFVKNGGNDWDIVNFFHETAGAAGVGDHSAVASLSATSYPNPFTTSTQISFELNTPANVLLTVEDMLGRPVATVASGRYGSGPHEVLFNANDLAPGVYRYTLHANGESVSRSMSLVK